ncbi:class I SAM-dependent methyltransferase [[Actinomadura] parvosata]|uniref:class I SAM-dependent methyltransferase n=1 Tax=[Actinomadura] parvosata TaxID=1955412 RepID=UPI00406BEE01
MTPIADPRSFDRFALDYDRFVSLLPGQNTAWLASLGLKGERALDAGYGSGHAVSLLADHFSEVLGLDLSGPLIDLAAAKRARPNVRYLASDLFDLRDEDGFDLVYSHTMLHHVEDYRAGPGTPEESGASWWHRGCDRQRLRSLSDAAAQGIHLARPLGFPPRDAPCRLA